MQCVYTKAAITECGFFVFSAFCSLDVALLRLHSRHLKILKNTLFSVQSSFSDSVVSLSLKPCGFVYTLLAEL